MAAVIHELWEREDSGLLIMPASVPIDAPQGAGGADALPRGRLDARDRVRRRRAERASAPARLRASRTSSASRRRGGSRARSTWARRRRSSRRTRGSTTARSSSAASSRASRRRPSGTRCGGSRPGDLPRRGPRPVLVLARADDRADGDRPRAVALPRGARRRGDPAAAARDPGEGRLRGRPLGAARAGEVPDEMEARLVVLGPEHPHASGTEVTAAREMVARMLEERAAGPRVNRNMLVFLAPDKARLEELREAARFYLAWSSIKDEWEELNLDAQQRRHAESQTKHFDETVQQRIGETFIWMLTPRQELGSSGGDLGADARDRQRPHPGARVEEARWGGGAAHAVRGDAAADGPRPGAAYGRLVEPRLDAAALVVLRAVPLPAAAPRPVGAARRDRAGRLVDDLGVGHLRVRGGVRRGESRAISGCGRGEHVAAVVDRGERRRQARGRAEAARRRGAGSACARCR